MKYLKLFSWVIILGWVATSCQNNVDQPDNIKPMTHMDSISYIIGYDYGTGIHDQEIKADPLMIYKGIYDALEGNEAYFNDSVREQLVQDFNEVVKQIEEKRYMQMVIKNKQEGKKFLAQNKDFPGVVELPSGLQYKILKIGNGDFPAANDSITIHYRAMYTDRTTFDMSYETGPVGIRVDRLVKGLSDGIQMMKKGAIYEFYIPSELGYGDQNYRDLIPGGTTVIYSVELIDIHKK